MAKTATTKKTKAAASAPKKAGAKMTGKEKINIDTPPKKKQRAAHQAAAYFLTTTLKGYMVNPYSKGSKNMINVVFHKGGVPPKSRKPVMSLDLGGKALRVKWKVVKSLYSDKQATCQGIQVDSACYHGYADTMDHVPIRGDRHQRLPPGSPSSDIPRPGMHWHPKDLLLVNSD